MKLRVARPTDNMSEIIRFYRDGLGLTLLGSFEDHEGFDGVMLGRDGVDYHLEFTHKRGDCVGRAPTEEHILVFYIPGNGAWDQAVGRMQAHRYEPVHSYNPYWDKLGVTFEDPDGYRVVLQKADWNP